jgi:hypothetical protein
MLRIDREVHAETAATPERCRELLSDVVGYPAWSSLITSVTAAGGRLNVRAELLGLSFEMLCELEIVGGDRIALRRLPYDDTDEERFEAVFTLGPQSIALHVVASIDAPGPARLIRGRVERRLADDLLADFTRAL